MSAGPPTVTWTPGHARTEHVGERVRRLDLAREGDRDPHDLHAGGVHAVGEGREVVVERVSVGAGVAGDLLGREERERRPVGDEVERGGGERRAHHPLRRFDRRDRGLVRIVFVEAGPVAERRDGIVDRARYVRHFAARAPERRVEELLLVRQRALLLERREARKDPPPEGLERRARQERLPSLEVRVDRQHPDAVLPQPCRERRHRQIRRGRVAARGVDEGYLGCVANIHEAA